MFSSTFSSMFSCTFSSTFSSTVACKFSSMFSCTFAGMISGTVSGTVSCPLSGIFSCVVSCTVSCIGSRAIPCVLSSMCPSKFSCTGSWPLSVTLGGFLLVGPLAVLLRQMFCVPPLFFPIMPLDLQHRCFFFLRDNAQSQHHHTQDAHDCCKQQKELLQGKIKLLIL